jgi:hypothetical protein
MEGGFEMSSKVTIAVKDTSRISPGDSEKEHEKPQALL